MKHENDEPSSNPGYRKVFVRELKAWSRGRVHRRDEVLGSRFFEHMITMMVEKAGPSRMGLQLFAVTLTLPSEKQESLKECASAFLRASDPNTPSWAIHDDEGGWLVLVGDHEKTRNSCRPKDRRPKRSWAAPGVMHRDA